MKKILAFLVAALMIGCLTVTVFATTEEEVNKANLPSAQVGEGKTVAPASDVTVAVWHVDTTTAGAAEKASLRVAVEAANKELSKKSEVLYLVDVSTTDGSNTAKLKFAMPTGKALSYVLVYQGGNWKKAEATYANGVLTLTSGNGWAAASPVAIMVESTASGSPTSPQTGEVSATVYVACAAVMAMAAAAFFVKSRKAA